MARLRMGVIGVGHLGKEHARILAGMPDVELIGVADVNGEQVKAVASRCNTRAFTDYRPLLGGIDAAILAVPTCYHHAVARDCLKQGLALLIEKPLASTPEQGEDLVQFAERNRATLQVGHIERFNPAFEELTRYQLQPAVIHCQRVSGFTGRSTDIGAVLDVMIHDIDLVLHLAASPVTGVQAVAQTLMGGHEDVVMAQVTFASGCVADLMASRVNPAPLRRMQLWGPEGTICLDFAKRTLHLAQPAGERRVPGGPSIESVELDRNQGDQLTRELHDFVRCVQTNSRPRCSGEDGLAALRLAGQILASCAAHARAHPQRPTTGLLFQPLPTKAAA
jgi:predicted dehydrogenase